MDAVCRCRESVLIRPPRGPLEQLRNRQAQRRECRFQGQVQGQVQHPVQGLVADPAEGQVLRLECPVRGLVPGPVQRLPVRPPLLPRCSPAQPLAPMPTSPLPCSISLRSPLTSACMLVRFP